MFRSSRLRRAYDDYYFHADATAAKNQHFTTRHFQRWYVRLALCRMNHVLEKQLGETVTEKRHHLANSSRVLPDLARSTSSTVAEKHSSNVLNVENSLR